METSARKPLWSQRRSNSTSTMTPRRPPPPPLPSLSNYSLPKSPTKNRQLQQAGGQSLTRNPNKGKEKMKDTIKFPGFVNSFLSNTPLHPPKRRLASSQRDFGSIVEEAADPTSENIASSPLSSPIKSLPRPLSSRRVSQLHPTEPLESPSHQEAAVDIEMELPDMETGNDVDGLVEELAEPEDFLSFEPLSPQDEVLTVKLKRRLHSELPLSFAISSCLMQHSQAPSQHCNSSSLASRRMSSLCDTMWMLVP